MACERWTCAYCLGTNEESPGYGEPRDPDAECSVCGVRPNETTRLRLAVERLREQLARPAAGPAFGPGRMTSHEAAGFYRFRTAKALWMATQRHPAKYPHVRMGRRILYIRPESK